MKVIFLDIDGVLNSRLDHAATHHKMNVMGDGCIGIYKPRLRFLKEIVDATNAKIVLVSSWKDCYEKYKRQVKDYLTSGEKELPLYLWCERDDYGYYLHKKFRSAGLEVFDTTLRYENNCYGWDRGAGIIKYLEDHPDVTDWIVLDDEIFEDYNEMGILPHLVKTSFYTGALDEYHVKRAINLLIPQEVLEQKQPANDKDTK